MGFGFPEEFFCGLIAWMVGALVVILLIWGVGALVGWGIDMIRREKATSKAGHRWAITRQWPAMADIPLEETAEQLRRRWASAGKRI